MGLRLLWITPHLPRPGVSASRERWWALLGRLAQRHEVSVVALVDPEDARAEDIPPGVVAVHRVPKRRYTPDDPLALLPRTVAGGYADPFLHETVRRLVQTIPHDLLQYEFAELAACLVPSPCPLVLTMHQLGFADEAAEWRALGRQVRRGAVLLHRYLRELDFELRAATAVDHVITMSREDARRLLRFLPDLDVSVSPIGVDVARMRPGAVAPASPTDLLFVGNFVHPPNRDAVVHLRDAILPHLGTGVRVRIVGHGSREAIGDPRGLEVLGGVPDLRPHLEAARVVVAPVRFGTGMRGKVLDALALGRPVVATSLGIEGLGAVGGEHLLIADDPLAFAAACRRLLADAQLAARLGAAGRQLVLDRFDWDRIAEAHERRYDTLLASPRRVRRRAPPDLRRTSRLRGWPGIALGAALLGARGLAWHLRGASP